MMSVHEFRNPTPAWNNASNVTSWTTVQGSSAWPSSAPKNPHVAVQKPSSYVQQPQTMKVPVNMQPTLGATPTSFQWTSSWDPVISPASYHANQKKSPLGMKTQKDKVSQSKFDVQVIAPPQQQQPIQAIVPQLMSSQLSQIMWNNQNIADEEDEDEEIDDPEDLINPILDENGVPIKRAKISKKKSTEDKQLIEDELSKQNLYKTELCRSFCETGVCRYGHKCQFAHGEHELRPVMRHPKYKTETCKTFSNTGTCPYGNRCRFIHPGVTWNTSWEDDMLQQMPDEIASVMEHLSLGNNADNEDVHIRQMNALGLPTHHLQNHAGHHLVHQGIPMPMPIMMPMQMVMPNHQIHGHPGVAPHPNLSLPKQTASQPETTVPAKSAVAAPSTAKATDQPNAEDDDESDSKPRLAFFQNLTVP